MSPEEYKHICDNWSGFNLCLAGAILVMYICGRFALAFIEVKP